MLEQCGRASIPGDPEAIHEAARGLERDAERGEEILADIRQSRDTALAGWSAPSAEEFGAFVSRALSFQTDQIEAKRRAAQIWHTYAEELRAAQRALEQAIENEQSAERASERAEEDSRAEGKAEDAAGDAREDQVSAARDAAEAAERASQAMEGVIDGLAAVPQGPVAPPEAGGIPPGGRLKIPDPGESLLDRLFGRDYIYPEEVPEFLEMGGGGALFSALGRVLVGAAKAGPRRTRLTPGGGLGAHEGVGRGHTLTRHVGLTDDGLRARLAKETNLPRASTFENRALAEDAVSGTLTANRSAVEHWVRHSTTDRLRITQEFDRAVGRTLAQGQTASQPANSARIVVFRDSSALGYHVKTAFPTP